MSLQCPCWSATPHVYRFHSEPSAAVPAGRVLASAPTSRHALKATVSKDYTVATPRSLPGALAVLDRAPCQERHVERHAIRQSVT
jgi:hypothetical protein